MYPILPAKFQQILSNGLKNWTPFYLALIISLLLLDSSLQWLSSLRLVFYLDSIAIYLHCTLLRSSCSTGMAKSAAVLLLWNVTRLDL